MTVDHFALEGGTGAQARQALVDLVGTAVGFEQPVGARALLASVLVWSPGAFVTAARELRLDPLSLGLALSEFCVCGQSLAEPALSEEVRQACVAALATHPASATELAQAVAGALLRAALQQTSAADRGKREPAARTRVVIGALRLR